MIQKVNIDSFKCLYDEDLEFKPLTIITGLNSTGKSSLIQSILLPIAMFGNNGGKLLENVITLSYESLRNKYLNSKQVSSGYDFIYGSVNISINSDSNDKIPTLPFLLDLERNVYYLSANRIGAESSSKISPNYYVGVNGEYILGTFDKEKSTPLRSKLVKDDSSYTLSTQVNYWLSYVSGMDTELQTEKRLDDMVGTSFKSDGLSNISPLQLGAGISYLTKILITCLRAKKNHIIIIENPEIHLHPASQAKLGEFFTFIANAGIQIIIETHCDHLINKVAYEIYKKRFNPNNATIFYKGGVQKKFEVIEFNKDGKFSVDFPDGFLMLR